MSNSKSSSAQAASLSMNPLFPKLLDKISTFRVGDEFTVRGCFLEIEWNKELKKDRLRLGRLFKNNVDERSIQGVEAVVRKATDNTQKYRIVGPVSFIKRFVMGYDGLYKQYGTLIANIRPAENDAFLFYNLKKSGHTLQIEAVCRQCNAAKSILFRENKKIQIESSGLENRHIAAIKAIWFSLVALWIHEDQLEAIQNITLFSTNSLMLERCARHKIDTANNLDYETVIQRDFSDFIAGNKMQLQHHINAVSLNHEAYTQLLRTFAD